MKPHFQSLPGESRLLWSPLVHELFDEACYFFLITGGDNRSRVLLDEVRELLPRIGVFGATCHMVYGPMDVLVRVWLTPARRQAFLRALQSEELGTKVESVMEFKAKDIEYAWADNSFCRIGPSTQSLSALEPRRESIAQIVEAVRDGRDLTQIELATLAELQEQELLSAFTSPPGVKLYMFLYSDHRNSRISTSEEVFSVAEIASSTGLKGISVYGGDGLGFCDLILKGIADDYRHSLEYVHSLQDHLVPRQISGWTLVPADYGVMPEGESIDAALDLTRTGRLSERLSPFVEDADQSSLMAGIIDDSVRSWVSEFLENLPSTFNWREMRRCERIVANILARNKSRINRELSFLASIDADLRILLDQIRSFNDLETGDRVMQHDTATSPPGINDASPFDSMGTHELLSSLLALVERIADEEFPLRGVQITEWLNWTSAVDELKSAFVSGQFVRAVLDGSFDQRWLRWLQMIPRVASMQIRLEDAIETIRGLVHAPE